jgi:hypothetical protein
LYLAALVSAYCYSIKYSITFPEFLKFILRIFSEIGTAVSIKGIMQNTQMQQNRYDVTPQQFTVVIETGVLILNCKPLKDWKTLQIKHFKNRIL